MLHRSSIHLIVGVAASRNDRLDTRAVIEPNPIRNKGLGDLGGYECD